MDYQILSDNAAQKKELDACYDRIDKWLDQKGIEIMSPSQLGCPCPEKSMSLFNLGVKIPLKTIMQPPMPLKGLNLGSSPLFQKRCQRSKTIDSQINESRVMLLEAERKQDDLCGSSCFKDSPSEVEDQRKEEARQNEVMIMKEFLLDIQRSP